MRPSILIALYLAAIVAANLLVTALGPSVSIACAFFFIGLNLTSRDPLHKAWEGRWLVWKMGALIGAGSLLSYAINRDAGPIALASFVAFAISETLDAVVYTTLGERSYLVRVNGSNIVAAAADSLIFPALAFGLPLLWPVVLGQFVAKVVGGAVWSWMLRRREAIHATT